MKTTISNKRHIEYSVKTAGDIRDLLTARLEQIIASLTRAYRRRKALGLPTDHLLPRCRRLSAAYLESKL